MASENADASNTAAAFGAPTPRPLFDAAAVRSIWRVNRVYWLVLVFSGVWALFRALGWDGLPPLRPPAAAAVALAFLTAAISLGLRTRMAVQRGGYGRAHPSRIGWIFTVLDLTAVSVGLRLTGGASSGLWPILFVIVVGETVLEPTREAWYVRGGALVALLVASVPIPPHGGYWIVELATRLVFLTAVTSVARRLREGSDREKAEIATLRAELTLSEERSHLSREVHDGVGNSLAAAVLRLEVAARELERGRQREAPGDLLREEAQALRSAMSSVRDWTFWTRPWPALETGATGVAPRGGDLLVAEIDRLSRRISLPIQVTGAALLDDPIVSLPLRLVVLRIAQEALTNVAKHAAGATRAQVQLDREASDLILTICDDGPGLCGAVLPADTHPNAASDSADHSAAPAPGAGIGMASMRERARGAGGSLTIETAPRGGVIVCARLPLPLNRKDR